MEVSIMATAVIMPRQGQSVESCLIGKWYKKKGDKVSAGDLLFTYETDKATFEEESKVDGILLDIFFEEDEDVECLVNVCVIGAEGESTEEFRPVAGGSGGGSSVGSNKEEISNFTPSSISSTSAITPPAGASDGSFARISPRAKKLAEKTQADLKYAVPTGANGRIIESDVQDVLSQGYRSPAGMDSIGSMVSAGNESIPAADNQSDISDQYNGKADIVPLSNVRKFIAKVMHNSLANSAQLTSHSSFDATNIIAYRNKLKSMPDAGGKTGITVTDIIIYAASRILIMPQHKSMNAHFLGDKLALFNDAHIGVAVDTPRGLLVPTIFNVNAMSLTELSAHAKELFEKCKQGSVEPDLLKGASFTISNLGGLGVEMFTPILNPPQTGILGVCNTIERLKNGKPYPALGLSITYDHQAMDGADSARFLKDLAEYLENFSANLD